MGSRYNVALSKDANKYIEALPKPQRENIKSAILDILETPKYSPRIKQLQGPHKGKYRYRLGSIRIIYSIKEDQLLIQILNIGPRGDIYK